MSSFFTAPASQRERKRQDTTNAAPKKRNTTSKNAPQSTKQPRHSRDESISGSDSNDDIPDTASGAVGSDASSDSSSDSGANETAAERRLKLAERYLESIRNEVAEGQEIGFDAEEIDRELIAARLKEDVAEEKGRVYRRIAEHLDLEHADQTFFQANTKSSTAVAICPPYVYTASKDITLIKWELPESTRVESMKSSGAGAKHARRQPKQLAYAKGEKRFTKDPSYKHHTASILCVAASADGKLVVTGGADNKLIVWDAATLVPLKVFTQHRDSIMSVAFRGNTNQLFTASKDRTIKIWSMDELAYVETLFGHQDEVVDIAAVGGNQERCVSVGARDRSARLWKVVEESQLVFRGGGFSSNRRDGHSSKMDMGEEAPLKYAEGSLDRVIQLDTQLFVTGSDSGALSLYALYKKKPLHTIPLAHGVDPPLTPQEASAEKVPSHKTSGQPTPRWITALACVPFSDLFVSGSWDGWIRVWRLSSDSKAIEAMSVVGHVDASANGDGDIDRPTGPVKGVINDLAVYEKGYRGEDELCIVAAVGTQCRLGQWMTVKGRNGAVVFNVPRLPANGLRDSVHEEAIG